MTWNIGKGLCNKLNDSNFTSLISNYDIICLSECWISENDIFDVHNYRKVVFPRKRGKGGGIVIFYRENLHTCLSVVENVHDCIIWLKLTQSGCEDIYVAFCYFPPENSTFYNNANVTDIDLFQSLEDSISIYKDLGKVLFAAGDLNARTGIRDDFITNDSLSNSIDDLLNVFNYEYDINIGPRRNMDKSINAYGRNLLSLCKSTGLRIVNGRHTGDPDGSYTFLSSNGTSTIDYVLVDAKYFKEIMNFSSGTFTTFSDHAPIYFSIRFYTPLVKRNVLCDTGRCVSRSVKWVHENVQLIREGLRHNDDALTETVSGSYDSQSNVNTCVNSFCDTIYDIVSPFCDIHSVKHRQSDVDTDMKCIKKKVISDDKPWFNETCKRKYKEYKTALYNFNKCKSIGNQRILTEKKSAYKKLEIRLKRQYKRHDGDMKEYLRKYNPKEFHKYFQKSKKHVSENVSLNQFVRHFSDIGQCGRDNSDAIDDNTFETSVFEELDCSISEDEIVITINNLKRNKCGEDCMLNELFKDCKDIMVSYLLKLFNGVFLSGFFPESWSKGCIVPIFKKGDVNDTNNYRGITLISCLGKLFTSILNRRIRMGQNS